MSGQSNKVSDEKTAKDKNETVKTEKKRAKRPKPDMKYDNRGRANKHVKVEADGMSNFKNQKYSSLKKECVKTGQLFKDPEFPASSRSLFHSKIDKEIEWKRPGELCQVPKLVFEGVTYDDLHEGELGNTWFVSACSALAKEQKLFNKVIPDIKDQEWTPGKNDYAGIFKFQFWRYGKWVEVVIDDQLPTKDDKLVFCHSKSRNEFWSALLEKAYAKLYGDYESLMYGETTDALVDFTGGIPEKLCLPDLKLGSPEASHEFFEQILDLVENRALINVFIKGASKGDDLEGPNGLIKGHGYILTDAQKVKVNRKLQDALGANELRIVRLRNPWGTKEWTGAWSDGSPQWNSLSQSDRNKMGLKFEQEGEFWMTLTDFIQHFTNVEILHFVNTSFFSLKKRWVEVMYSSSWTPGARGSRQYRAGGGFKNKETFLENPQYVFDVSASGSTMMFSLEQDDSHIDKVAGQEHKSIGLVILRTEANRKYRMHEIGEKKAESEYKKSRNVFYKLTNLPVGRYVLLPTTEAPNQHGGYLLRMYAWFDTKVQPMEENCPKSSCCSKPYVTMTRLVIQKAKGLKGKEGTKSMTAYVIIKCESETVRSPVCAASFDPDIDFHVVFYRKAPTLKPITIEVHNKNLISDDFVGVATIEDDGEETPKIHSLKLYGKGKEKETEMPGTLSVELTSSDDLTAF